jgi:hypothetical protein
MYQKIRITLIKFLFLSGIISLAAGLSSARVPEMHAACGSYPDTLLISQAKDSLVHILDSLKSLNALQNSRLSELRQKNLELFHTVAGSKTMKDSLLNLQVQNDRSILSLKQTINRLNTQMEEKNQLLRDKDYQLLTKDSQLKDFQNSAALRQVKLEGDINVNSTKAEAREREVNYLQKSNEEKDRLIKEKTEELEVYFRQKDHSLQLIDSLQKNLNKRELEFARTSEREKIITAQLNDLQTKQKEATNRKKKIRFIQGVALKNYRTPDWGLAPQSASSTATYVISNKNAGKLEFDYITGVSMAMMDLSRKDSKFTYDAGLFVGFGGQNLFKNFYIGPSFKLFDYFHINTGANIAEYQQLKNGFNEGDVLPPGINIPTVREWKVNYYLGFTVDFELLTNIPKKM